MKHFLLSFPVFMFAATEIVFAQNRYQTLVDTGINPNDGVAGYLNAIYLILISLAALFAVIKIILAGVKYMLSDVVTNKQSAKDDIKNALLGLIIIMATALILEIINPNLTRLDVFGTVQPISNPNISTTVQNNTSSNTAGPGANMRGTPNNSGGGGSSAPPPNSDRCAPGSPNFIIVNEDFSDTMRLIDYAVCPVRDASARAELVAACRSGVGNVVRSVTWTHVHCLQPK